MINAFRLYQVNEKVRNRIAVAKNIAFAITDEEREALTRELM
jgi:hypothetical protein